MTRFLPLLSCGFFLASCSAPPADAQLSDQDRDEVREIVREYILENPEIIEEALVELQRRARLRESQAQLTAVNAQYDAIYADPRDPRLGAEDPQVVIVEFMDYKCSYCRVAAEWVEDVNERYGDRVQFIFKEYPILGPDSREAAIAALAARRQGDDVYANFHYTLIRASGALPSERIDQLASLAGVDVAQMRADMDDPAITAHVDDVRQLGRALDVTGTPFFIIGDTLVPGANGMALERALMEELNG